MSHALRQFVFECMNLTTVDDFGSLNPSVRQTNQRDMPWDDPYPYFVGMIEPKTPEYSTETACRPASEIEESDTNILVVQTGTGEIWFLC